MYKHDMMTAVVHARSYKAHKERLRSVRGIVDCGPPFHNPHVYLKLKKMEYDERKNLEIDNANKNLLRRLQKVLESDESLNRRKGGIKGPTTMNAHVREVRQEQIRRDNIGIAYRIEHKKPFYLARKWEEDYQNKKYLQGLWSTNNNEQYAIYNPTPRTNRSMMSLSMMSTRESVDFKKEEKHKEEKHKEKKHKEEKHKEEKHNEVEEEDNYEDDFEEADDKKEKEKEKEKDGERFAKGTRFPPIAKPKRSEKQENGSDTRRSKAESHETTRTKKRAEPQEKKSEVKSHAKGAEIQEKRSEVKSHAKGAEIQEKKSEVKSHAKGAEIQEKKSEFKSHEKGPEPQEKKSEIKSHEKGAEPQVKKSGTPYTTPYTDFAQ